MTPDNFIEFTFEGNKYKLKTPCVNNECEVHNIDGIVEDLKIQTQKCETDTCTVQCSNEVL